MQNYVGYEFFYDIAKQTFNISSFSHSLANSFVFKFNVNPKLIKTFDLIIFFMADYSIF